MRVTEKGQVTIPKELRDELGIGAGSEVAFERSDDAIVIRKVRDVPARGRRFVERLRGRGDVSNLTLLTRDSGRYQTYFPTVNLITPN